MHIWTEEEKEYLKQITPWHHHREIQQLVNDKFNLDLSIMQIKGAIARYKLNTGLDGQFPKGHVPFNKGLKGAGGWEPTQFKKGNIPINHRPIGSERVNVDGYTEIKAAEPSKWRLKHITIWEKHNGPLPKGHAIIFGDGNKQNFDIDNLILVTRRQLLILNRNKLIQNNAELTKIGVVIANLHQKISEKNKAVK